MKNSHKITLAIIIGLGCLFFFTKLNWDQGFFLHPDERNIGFAVWGIDWPHQLNPHFFAYGSFPIYLIFILGNIANLFFKNIDFTYWEGAVWAGRFLSAFLAIFLVPLSYIVSKELAGGKKTIAPLLAAFFVATSAGLIQYAHFATFEIILCFEYLILFYVALKLNSFKKPILLTFLFGLIFGLCLATKITSFVLLPFSIFVIVRKTKLKRKAVVNKIYQLVFFFLVAGFVFIITSPFAVIDFASFKSSLDYEIAVGRGLPVFFTSQFIDTAPVVFQFNKIFPYIFNPVLAVLLIPAFFWLIYKIYTTRRSGQVKFFNFSLLLVVILILLSPAFLFVKWTRYMISVLPFVYITLSLFITEVIKVKRLRFYFFGFLIIFSLFWSFAFFNIYLKPDTRIQTVFWMSDNIAKNSKILVEDLDQGIDAIRPSFSNLIVFNFYDLDGSNPQIKGDELNRAMENCDYFLILSRRVYKNRFNNPEKFPYGAKFYKDLFGGKLGFNKIYESENPFSLFGIKINDDGAEETFQVFDHPKLILFKKNE